MATTNIAVTGLWRGLAMLHRLGCGVNGSCAGTISTQGIRRGFCRRQAAAADSTTTTTTTTTTITEEDCATDFYLQPQEVGPARSAELESHAALITPSTLHRNIIIVHPILKRLPKSTLNTTTELQVDEAKALVSTLGSHWTLRETIALNTTSENKKLLFGQGNFEIISEKVRELQRTSDNVVALFNVNMLTPLQQQSLREELGIDIYDRYMLVLLIFKQHARTKEAKLQTSLAEMAYFNQRLRRSRSEEIKVLLGQRDVHLRRILGELQSHRQLIRKRRQKLQLPVVSVVGYTNAGKTSLIKRFTNSEKLAPRNQLFATLDVTCHEGYLPRLSKVIYVDTVGFISDIPTQLIASFRATLEDALVADQLAHVFDLSNPDFERQCETVLETLETIQTPTTLRDTLLHVANKVDRVEDADKLITRAERVLGASALIASCKTGDGISNVLGRLEEGLITNTGRRMVKVRCPNGGDAYAEILRQSSSVENVSVDDLHPNDAILEVLMTTATESKLRAKFRLRPDILFE